MELFEFARFKRVFFATMIFPVVLCLGDKMTGPVGGEVVSVGGLHWRLLVVAEGSSLSGLGLHGFTGAPVNKLVHTAIIYHIYFNNTHPTWSQNGTKLLMNIRR